MEGSSCAKTNWHKEGSQHIRQSANTEGQTHKTYGVAQLLSAHKPSLQSHTRGRSCPTQGVTQLVVLVQ